MLSGTVHKPCFAWAESLKQGRISMRWKPPENRAIVVTSKTCAGKSPARLNHAHRNA